MMGMGTDGIQGTKWDALSSGTTQRWEASGSVTKSSTLQLISMSARKRGMGWVISERPLVLGRGGDVDIVLDDPIASRRHGLVCLKGSMIRYEDLGSRNDALLNGQPIRQGVLEVGDELAIGSERFLVAGTMNERMVVVQAPEQETRSWSSGESVSLPVDSARAEALGRPGTVQDLAWLYEVARDLSGAPSAAALFEALRTRLSERFHPQALWLLLVRGAEREIITRDAVTAEGNVDAPADEFPEELVDRAIREGRAFLMPQRVRKGNRRVIACTLASPVSVGGVTTGALVLRAEMPHGCYDEEDLQLLALLCQSVAPVVVAVQEVERLKRDNARLRELAGESVTLVGVSKGINDVRDQIARVADSSLNVLITGDTGTGKELVARLIHAGSARKNAPFVTVNCAAIPRELFEGELFGYERGAYTGATRSSMGLLAETDGGTLFLDEIGDLSLDNQARILRVIENHSFRRIGARCEITVDMRIIAATNKDLAACINAGAFREDLYHRLNGVEIALPPLRDRRDDIPPLAEYFLDMFRWQAKRPVAGITHDALVYLVERPWPGNVRELRNCIQRAILMGTKETIQPTDVMAADAASRLPHTAADLLTLGEVEKRHIEAVFRQCGGNTADASRVLKIGRSTLYAKLIEYGIR